MKKENGITIVALIITIVVLLILAGVSIKAVSKTSIISKTTNVAEAYNQEEANEYAELENISDSIKKNSVRVYFAYYIRGENSYSQRIGKARPVYVKDRDSINFNDKKQLKKLGLTIPDGYTFWFSTWSNILGEDNKFSVITIPQGFTKREDLTNDDRWIAVFMSVDGKVYTQFRFFDSNKKYIGNQYKYLTKGDTINLKNLSTIGVNYPNGYENYTFNYAASNINDADWKNYSDSITIIDNPDVREGTIKIYLNN